MSNLDYNKIYQQKFKEMISEEIQICKRNINEIESKSKEVLEKKEFQVIIFLFIN